MRSILPTANSPSITFKGIEYEGGKVKIKIGILTYNSDYRESYYTEDIRTVDFSDFVKVVEDVKASTLTMQNQINNLSRIDRKEI